MKFTEEQKRIVEMVKEGKSNNEIAKKMYISVATVERRLNNLYKKTGSNNKPSFICAVLKLEHMGLF